MAPSIRWLRAANAVIARRLVAGHALEETEKEMYLILIIGGLLLVAVLIAVAVLGRSWADRHERMFNTLAVLGLVGFVAAGFGTLGVLSEAECRHVNVVWIESGTEYVSQRSLDTTDNEEIWLDETTGELLVRGSSDPEAVEAFEQVVAFAQELSGGVGLTDSGRDRVDEYAEQFLRSSGCD